MTARPKRPLYCPAPVMRDKKPEVTGVLNSLNERLGVDVIRELNGRGDIEREDLEDVAEEFLRKQGLISAGP